MAAGFKQGSFTIPVDNGHSSSQTRRVSTDSDEEDDSFKPVIDEMVKWADRTSKRIMDDLEEEIRREMKNKRCTCDNRPKRAGRR